MRSKKAVINAITSLIYEFTRIVSAFLIPRLVLQSFGSDTNGINQSVTQFISYISLLTAGIGSVTTAALYRPIANNNKVEISGIVNATEQFLRKIARIFIIALFIFALIFPLFINEFDFVFTFSLVLILGIGTFTNYYFGLTYRMLLNADQKQYVYVSVQIILTIVQMFVAVILINNKFSIHIVQLVSSLIFMINPIFIYYFVKKKYEVDKFIEPNFVAIDQRWDAFGHQVASFVNDNTDLILLTMFTNLKEVSVYSVYFLVYNGIKMTVFSLITGTQAAFGNMIAKGETENIKRNLKTFEFFLHFLSIILYSSMALLITSFVDLYTINISDTNYHRPIFGYMISAVGFFMSVRIPYQSLAIAAGHFKQTRNGAIIESVLNIVLSISLVIPFGMNGLIISTLIATIFRTLQYGIYTSKNLLNRSLIVIFKRYLISVINIFTIVIIVYFIQLKNATNYFDWFINGLLVTGIGILTTIIFSLLFYLEDFVNMKNFVTRIFKKQT